MVTLQQRWERLIQSNAKRKQRLMDSLLLQVKGLMLQIWSGMCEVFLPFVLIWHKSETADYSYCSHFLFGYETENFILQGAGDALVINLTKPQP